MRRVNIVLMFVGESRVTTDKCVRTLNNLHDSKGVLAASIDTIEKMIITNKI